MSDTVARALRDTLISPNESDQNLEAANIVDGLFAIARDIKQLANAVQDADDNGHNARTVADAISGLASSLGGFDPSDAETNKAIRSIAAAIENHP